MAQAIGQLGGDRPVGARRCHRGHLVGDQAHPALQVGVGAGGLVCGGRRQHDVGPARTLVEERVEGDHRPGAGQRPLGQPSIGNVAQRVGAQQHEGVDLAVSGGLQDADSVEPVGIGNRRPRLREPGGAVGTANPARQQTGGQAHVERSVNIGAPQRRQEPHPVEAIVQQRRSVDDRRTRLRHVRSTQQHRDRAVRRIDQRLRGVELIGGHPRHVAVRSVEQRRDHRSRLARAIHQRRGRVTRQPGALRGDLDQLGAVLDDRVLQADEQGSQRLLRVGTQQDDRGTRATGVVDRGLRQAQDRVDRQPVTELGVHVVRPDHTLDELRPRIGRLVRQPGAAEHRQAARARTAEAVADQPRRGGEGVVPAGRDQRIGIANQRCRQAALVVDRLIGVAALVAQPTPVHRIGIHAVETHELVATRLRRDATSHRTAGAGGGRLAQIPRAGLEAVRGRRQRTDRAQLHDVAAEIRGKRLAGEGVDLGRRATVHEVDERIANHLVGEPGAAIAQDATLTVEVHRLGDGDRLAVVALFLHEPAFARTVGHRGVLKRALAALVAHRAIERVVDEQELEHPVLGLAHPVVLRIDDHAVAALQHARRLQRGSATGVDLDEAHAAHAHRVHAAVVAEPGDVMTGTLGGVDQQIALLRDHRVAVDRDGDRLVDGDGLRCLRHRGLPRRSPESAHAW